MLFLTPDSLPWFYSLGNANAFVITETGPHLTTHAHLKVVIFSTPSNFPDPQNKCITSNWQKCRMQNAEMQKCKLHKCKCIMHKCKLHKCKLLYWEQHTHQFKSFNQTNGNNYWTMLCTNNCTFVIEVVMCCKFPAPLPCSVAPSEAGRPHPGSSTQGAGFSTSPGGRSP